MIVENLSELELYCKLVEDNSKVKLDDEEMARMLKIEFNINVSIDVLKRMKEPFYEDEVLDKELIYRNVFQ